MTSPLVSVRGLSVAYRAGGTDVPVVRDVSFDVSPYRTHALVGESGSGKSTVAGTLLGHLRHGSRVTGGTVEVDGRQVFGLAPDELAALRGGSVAMVAQNAGQALTPSMRVGGQIAEALRAHGLGRAACRQAVHDLLDQVRLPRPAELARRYPHQLSGGQQQRVAIAMAIAARPRVLVLDEPTTGLDVVTQDAVLGLLCELAGELGLATVLVSHDLGVVARMADEVTVLCEGRVVESAPAKRLFAEPEDPYTRRLLASVPRVADGGLAEVAEDGSRRIRDRAPQGEEPVVVSVRDLRVRYRTAPAAVDGVSLELRRGEVLGLVGESGSGKSTVAMTLAGLHPPTEGTLRYSNDGHSADLGVPARRRTVDIRRRVALVFQNADTALNPRRTVGAAVRRPLRLFRRVPREEASGQVERLFREVRLDAGFTGRLPAQLSGGQRQRVGIARALAGEPDVVIADEITTALDVSVQAQVLALLDDLRRERRLACLFISHDLAVVRGIADRVAVLWQGGVVEEGPVEAVFARPGHPYTRQLLAAAPEPEPGQRKPGEPEIDWEHADGWVNLGAGHRHRAWQEVA